MPRAAQRESSNSLLSRRFAQLREAEVQLETNKEVQVEKNTDESAARESLYAQYRGGGFVRALDASSSKSDAFEFLSFSQ